MAEKKWIKLPLRCLVKADWNYKEDDADLLKKLVNNIKRNGQIENILVRKLGGEKYEIVNGNHRFDAMAELKVKECMCFNLGNISLAHAKRIAVETNETRFSTNSVALSDLISELSNDFDVNDLLETMPYTEEEFENFSQLSDFDWEGGLDSAEDSDYLRESEDAISDEDPDKSLMVIIKCKTEEEATLTNDKLKEQGFESFISGV